MPKLLAAITAAALLVFTGCSIEPTETNEPDEVEVSFKNQYTYDAAWSMLIDVCRSEGIDDDRCKCLMDVMVGAHGIDSAMYVAMRGHMHDEQADFLKAEIGEERAIGASDVYAYEQDDTCAYMGSGDDEGEAAAADSAMDTAAADAPAPEAEGE